MRNKKLLVVDGDSQLCTSLQKVLTAQGYGVRCVSCGEDALVEVRTELPDLVLLDVHLSDLPGLDVLRTLKSQEKDLPVIMISASNDLETAIEAMRAGALDYINKPLNIEELLLLVGKALETGELKREIAGHRKQRRKGVGVDSIVGQSAGVLKLVDLIRRVASSDAGTVFIQGESGTGKELVAKALHYESTRSDKPFVAINCAAVPETLLESELMGHEKGAFTDARSQKKGIFEVADGGTVFLDEIGDMDLPMQAKLLRVLEERTVRRVGGTKEIPIDVRVVSATNRDLQAAMKESVFRSDLYYRIQVIPLSIPPLRERPQDIPLLVDHFIREFNVEFGKDVKGVSPLVDKFLREYPWPGNIRELRNVIERAVILETEETILIEHLPQELISEAGDLSSPLGLKLPPEGIDIEDVERELIRQALQLADGNQSQAAKLLNLGIDAFRYRMKKFGYM